MPLNNTFTAIPRYNLPTTVPFTRQTATTLVERLEELFVYVTEIDGIIGARDLAYGKLLDDANATIGAAITTISGYAEQAHDDAVAAESMRSALEQALASVTAATASLNAATDHVDASLATALTNIGVSLSTLRTEMAAELTERVRLNRYAYDVLDFGAVGDGIVDDTAAIMAASHAAGGAIVYFPAGHRYRITSTLVQPSGQAWSGGGSDATLPGESQGVAVLLSDFAGDAVRLMHRLDNINVDATINARNGRGIYSDGSAITIRDVNVSGFKTGIRLENVWYTLLDRVSLMQNAKGLSLDYCYNVAAVACRIYAKDMAGNAGIGVELTGSATLGMTCGSIEYYSRAVTMTSATKLSLDTVYFESAIPMGSKCFGIYADGAGIGISAFNCHVFYAHHTAWILYNGADSGGVLNSKGNKFTNAVVDGAPGYAYLWSGGRNTPLNVFLEGDQHLNVVAGAGLYWTGGLPSSGSRVTAPGQATSMSGTLVAVDGVSVARSERPSAPVNGQMMWDGAIGKLIVWHGTKWVDAMGVAV